MKSPTGPVPKRTSERRRRNKEGSQVETVAASGVVTVPEPHEDWHPIARDWYLSLALSGQSRFYEPSDWQTARYLAEAMSRNLAASRMSAQLFAAVLSGATELLTTEGARRRMRMEVERATNSQVPAGVTALDEYRAALVG